MKRICRGNFWLATFFGIFLQDHFAVAEPKYPRIMAIAIGDSINLDQPDYQKNISKADIVVLGFWPHWKENEKKNARDVVRAIKANNPNILVGQYTILNEAKASDNPDKTSQDIATKLDQEHWWLKGPTGDRIQHTAEYGAWETNPTAQTKPDTQNRRFPEWLAQRNYQMFFANTPEFDFWFLDNSGPQSPVVIADWNNNGMPVPSALPSYSQAYRLAHRAYWDAIRRLQPKTLLIGNALDLTSDEYKGQLNGALLEAAMGEKWSLYERQGWDAMRLRYYEFIQDTRAPKIVGFNVWGGAKDYQKMRFGLTTCLLNDGYFSYTDQDKGYANPPWFDEYDVDLGKPTEPAPEQPWKDGIYRRLFEKGAVFVNPTDHEVNITLAITYKKIAGKQDPLTNSGQNVQSLTIRPADGIILLQDTISPTSPTLSIIPK